MNQALAHQHDNRARAVASATAPASSVETAFRRARRHSARVRLLKLGLPAAAVLMVVAFVGKSWLSTSVPVGVSVGSAAIESGRLVMADPKLEGFTRENRPYAMTADRAIQDIGSADLVDLEGIDARLPFNAENWITMNASTGKFDRAANTLDIDSDITVSTDTGITALLKSAVVDIASGNLETPDPVDITLDGTRIEAQSLSVRDKGAVMIFQNRVRVVIDARRLQTAAKAEGAPHEN